MMSVSRLRSYLVANRRAILIPAGIVALIIIGVVVWWLASPLFINKTVSDQFPLSAGATLPAGVSQPSAEQTMVAASQTNRAMAEGMPEATQTAARLKTGMFRDGDGFHKGSGSATIYKQTDGTYLLRLENFKATNGPDLHVYLSSGSDPKTNAEVLDPGYIDLAVLKGNQGDQNYIIPASVDLTRQNSVVIWCKAFSVIFSVASLRAA